MECCGEAWSPQEPYKGNAPAVTDVLAEHVPLMFSDPVPALPPIREGKLVANRKVVGWPR